MKATRSATDPLCAVCSAGIATHVCPRDLDLTPMLELPALGTSSAHIWLKPEWTDPEGPDPLRSIKRKPACLLYSDALEKHYVDPGKILVSATSGNLGIELGLLASVRGHPFLAVVPSAIPEYNIQILLALGISVLKTEEQETCPREFTVFFARGYAHEFHHRLVNLEQYYSWLNPLAHSLTTARELFEFDRGVDHVVLSVGSCGTVCGISQYAVLTGQRARITGVQPAVNQGIPGTHVIKGDCRWSPENYSPVLLADDDIVTVDRTDSYAYTTWLWGQGIDAGPSTGMALAQAHRMVREGATGNIVVISPDSGFKYGDLLTAELTRLRDEMLDRHAELEIDEVLGAYLAHLEADRGLAWTLKRVRECYPASAKGCLYGVQDIEEIVTGAVPLTVPSA